MFKNNKILVTGYYLAALILLALLVYFVALNREFNTVLITPRIIAETPSIFTIYWPGSSGAYTEGRHAQIKYPAGESQPTLTIPAFPNKLLLRVDPIAQKGTVLLLGLEIERFGVKLRFQADDLSELLVKGVDTTIKPTASGLEITATSGDPQIYFKELAPPLPPTRTIIGLLSVFLLLSGILVWTGSRFLNSPPQRLQLSFLVCPAALVFFSLTFSLPQMIALPACALLVIALQHSAVALTVTRPQLPSLQQWWRFIFVVCFFGIIYLPLWLTLLPSRGFMASMKELTDNPELSWKLGDLNETGRKIVSSIEENLVRNLAFREKYIHLNANIKIFGLGFSPTSKAILGKNGMFFEGYGERRVEQDISAHLDNVTDYMGLSPFSNEELEAWRVCLEERYYWLKERGIDYIFALAPSKAIVYTENLPDQILRVKMALNKPTRFEQLSSYLKLHSKVPFVDLSEPLLLAKHQAEATGTLASMPLYYRTDFHWTYFGAYVAYRAIIEEIDKRYPAYKFTPAPLTDFTIKTRTDWMHTAFLNVLGLDPVKHRNETYLTFMPKRDTIYASIANFGSKGIDDYSLSEPVYNDYEGHLTATRELKNPRGEAKTIFIIGDSFSEKYFGFFSGHAKNTVNFRTVNSFFTTPYKKYAPDLVVQEMLNMYLLQKPPTNPPEIGRARVAALAAITEAGVPQ